MYGILVWSTLAEVKPEHQPATSRKEGADMPGDSIAGGTPDEAQEASAADAVAHLAQQLDVAYLVETLCRLARVPTDVPLGFQTLMEPDDPKLVHYVQEV